MYLTKAEEQILMGEEGEAKALAMNLLVAIGDVYEARRMIRVQSAQISGVSYKTIGEPGLEFLRELSSKGAVASIKSMLNPAGMDLVRWRRLGVPEDFAGKQLEIMECFGKMKIEPTCTCIPYHACTAPAKGEHVAWAESSAVVFANSVMEAYTNREGGPTALASSILGKTPLYGMHLDEERVPGYDVKVKCKLNSDLDFSLLGYWIGENLGSRIPRISNLKETPSRDQLKALSASIAASGSVPMFSMREGIETEEKCETATVYRHELHQISRSLSDDEEFEHICLGCPHLSFEELKLIATLVSGKDMRRKLWCFTSRHVHEIAERSGYVGSIEKAGGDVICDTCMVVSPMREMGVEGMLTNSCKAAHYSKSLNRMATGLMSLEGCVQYALA